MKTDNNSELVDQPLPIPDELLEKVLKELAPAKQQKSVLEFIIQNPFSYTDAICKGGGCINLPDVVQHLRPKLHRHGLQILSFADPRPNRFGGKSPLHRWWLTRLER